MRISNFIIQKKPYTFAAKLLTMISTYKIGLFAVILTISINVNSTCFGQCVTGSNITTTYAHNNGQDGIMFDVVAINDIIISCFDMNFDPGTFNYEVYTKIGTAQGFETNAGAWNLIGSGTGITSAGNGNPTPINLNSTVSVCSGDRVAFYITNTGPGSANANYTNGTAINNVFVSDANLEVREMYGKVYPFGTSFSPRVFNGTIRYDAGVGCSVLPVELVNFEASSQGNRWVNLSWETASETNNDYFEIHRSLDTESWSYVTTVNGAGNSNELLNYSTKDFTPHKGVSYYRLTQVDVDGTVSEGIIRSVFHDPLNSTDLSIFPNPAKDIVTIIGEKPLLTNLKLENACGQEVKFDVLFHQGKTIKIDVSSLNSGVYFVRVDNQLTKLIKE